MVNFRYKNRRKKDRNIMKSLLQSNGGHKSLKVSSYNKKTKKRVGLILGLSLFVVVIGTTFAFINLTLQGTKKQVITAGNLNLELQEDTNNITLTNAMPMYDEVGMIQDAFTFRLVNNTTTDTNYILKLVDITAGTEENKLDTSIVKYYLTKDGVGQPALLSTLTNGQIDSGVITGNQTIDYSLRLWIDSGVTDNASIEGKSLSYRIDVEVSQKIETIMTTQDLVLKANIETLDYNIATAEQQKEMWTFTHPETEQTGALTDYRYIGANPNNYITFNNETWRIIGVFPTDDGAGKIEQRIKIIRDESIGNYSWNSNGTDWSTASLNTYLNSGDYYMNLSEKAKNQISDVVYYLGSVPGYSDEDEWIPLVLGANDYYVKERGTTVNDTDSINWTGKIGIMYPSDYAYTYAKGVDDVCYMNGRNCAVYNGGNPHLGWLFQPNVEWTITNSNYYSYIYAIASGGISGIEGLDISDYGMQNSVRPVAYLKSDIKISGEGTKENPYTIQ